MSTIGTWVEKLAQQFEQHDLFYGHGTDNAWDEAVHLVLGVMALPLDSDESVAKQSVPQAQQQQLEELAKRRIEERMPVSYLLGEAPFLNLSFKVTQDVLIPRSPVAELIEQQFLPWIEPHQIKNIVDVGTGSACIAIASAVHCPQAQVDAIDICDKAIAVAEENVKRHDLADRVHVLKCNLFDGLPDKRYDIIISNPPYVPDRNLAPLPAEYQHEPIDLALASGEDGLAHTRYLLAHAKDHLTEHGILIVEVGESEEAVKKAFPDLPLTWLTFENGGEGVFLIAKEML